MKEKIMPHNLEAEQSVLGSLFLSKYAITECMERLTKDQFYMDKHAKIFEVIRDLVEQKIPIDIRTVTEELEKRNWLKQIGDVEYLTEIINSVPTAANITEYIKIVEEKAVRRKVIEKATALVDYSFQSPDNINTFLDHAEKEMFDVLKNRKGEEFRTIQDVLYKTQADLERLAQNKGEITGLATGFYDLDKLTSGLHENELIIIAARPAMGKTAFALNLAVNIAMQEKKSVAIFNLEMGAEQLAIRMLSSTGQIEGNKLKTGKLEHNDWKRLNEAMSRLADTKIFIDDTAGMTINEIRAKCRRLASSEDGLDIVIIDYLQLIQGSDRYAGSRQQEVSEISRALKTMAMELKIPVIALAQLSRSVEGRDDKRPILSDLRESGSIEQDADIVAFLYRDSYYNKESTDDPDNSRSEFLIRKHRNGPTADINLLFRRNTSTFVNFIETQEM